MRRRRLNPLDEAIQHVISATDKTSALERKFINQYKGKIGVFLRWSLLVILGTCS